MRSGKKECKHSFILVRPYPCAYVQYSSNPLEIPTIFVKSITKSEPHRDNPSLVFRCFTIRDSQSLNQSH
ncbi:hypothetical protein HKD37_04G009770 [Glycine soja]